MQVKRSQTLPPQKTVLFICTGNACRSQMAEALLRHTAGDKFEALSAGTRPAGFVHPLALKTLESMGVSTAGLESKHVEELTDRPINIAITVCDNAAAECPTTLAADLQAHWALPDPSFYQGTDEERLEFCSSVAERLLKKIKGLAKMQFEKQSREQLSLILKQLADI